MKIPNLLLLILIMLSSCANPEADESAIMASMEKSRDSWNRGDLEGFVHNYWQTDSTQFIGKNGITYGFSSLLERYKKGYPDRASQGTLEYRFIHLERISSKAYYQVGKYTLERESDTLSGHFTLLWRKIEGQWRIVSDHSS